MIGPMTAAGDRVGRRDLAIALVLSLLGLLLMYANVEDSAVNADVLAIPLFLAVTAPLLWRRAAPLAAMAAVLGALVVHDLLFGAEVVRCGVVLPVTFLLVFSAGVRLERRESLLALAFGFAVILAEGITFYGSFGVFVAALATAVWAIGRIVRSRERMAAELEARTTELRDARDERVRLEVTADRAELAGQLDELLQERLGELARLAAAGAHPQDPAAATATLVAIEHASRATLEQMRRLVGVLRDDDSPAPLAPQPTLTHLEAVLVRARGADARLHVEGSPRVLPAAVELSAYRIVEHLLDALDDTPDAEVCVRFGEDALELTVRGRPRRGAEAALDRARDRAQLNRGTLRTSTRGGRAEAVVSLPVLAGV
jgi:hypothetical protein